MKSDIDYITKRPPHLLPDLNEWPINVLSNRRDAFIDKIVKETVQSYIDDNVDLMSELQTAVNLEDRRIKNDRWSVDPPNENAFWKSIQKTILEAEQTSQGATHQNQLTKDALTRIVTVYAEEIAGRFKPSMFQFARRFCALFFRVTFNKFRTGKFGFWGSSKHIHDKIRLLGPVELVRKLFKSGTVVFVPTHSSNLDSLLLGYTIDAFIGFPSSHYGAGLNLYNSEIAGYFMNRMGAYRVDRRKKNRIYLDTLKSTSRIAMELGVNSLFFPGGTRSRSGELEQDLKLGLLGTAVQAQRKLFQNGSDKKIFIVPLVISYSNILEDSSLCKNYLHRLGLSGLVKKRLKKKNTFLKVCRLASQTFNHEMINYISIAPPMDVFGNIVDQDGRSIDRHGQRIIKEEYFLKNGNITEDVQREMQYTRHLSTLVATAYREHNVVRLGQLCAYAFLQLLWQENKIAGIEATLKLASSECQVPYDMFIEKFSLLVSQFRDFEDDGLCLNETLLRTGESQEEMITEGFKQLRTYQIFNVLKIKSNAVFTDHIGLILYYSNRLECYFAYQRKL